MTTSFKNLLAGRTIVITGASRGLGRSMCLEAARQGAAVYFNYSQDDAAAQRTCELIRDGGGRAHATRVSVCDEAGINQWIKSLEKEFGPIDILINNAGISQPLPLALLETEDWQQVVDINLTGAYKVARAVLPAMIRRKAGVVLNIGSLAGLRLIEAPVHYAATKAAIKGFTEALCKEVSRYNIRVNCLAPGLLDDGVGRSLPEHRMQDYTSHVAMRRVGGLDEVARFAVFLTSPFNSYMNGATVMMDGGF